MTTDPSEKIKVGSLEIERVTIYRPAAEGYTSAAPKTYGGNARLIPISTAKVKWLDRPVIEVEIKRKRK